MTIVYLQSYLNFLYRQFVELQGADILISNGIAVDRASRFQRKRYVQFHMIIARSFALMARHFACSKYEIDNPIAGGGHSVKDGANIIEVNTPELRGMSTPSAMYGDFTGDEDDEKFGRQGSDLGTQDETTGQVSCLCLRLCGDMITWRHVVSQLVGECF